MRKILMVFGLAVFMIPSSAWAQGKGLRFEGEKITGKIQKPEIEFLVTKQNLTPKYELDLRESFLPKVVESVDRKPF